MSKRVKVETASPHGAGAQSGGKTPGAKPGGAQSGGKTPGAKPGAGKRSYRAMCVEGSLPIARTAYALFTKDRWTNGGSNGQAHKHMAKKHCAGVDGFVTQ